MKMLLEKLFGIRRPSKAQFTQQELEALEIRLRDAHAIVQKYGAVLEEHPEMICDEHRLPDSKKRIKESILFLLQGTSDEKNRSLLKSGYLMLSTFQPLTDAEKAMVAKQSEFDPRSFDPRSSLDDDRKTALASALSIWPAYSKLLEQVSKEQHELENELRRAEMNL